MRQRAVQLWFAPRKLLEHLNRLVDLALLEVELCERGYRRFAL
jgi:hypothetical protein